MFGVRSAPPTDVTMWMVVDYTDIGQLYRTTPPDIAARANEVGAVGRWCDHSFIDETNPFLHRRSESVAVSIKFTGAR
jgi:hypothetical protein